MNQLSIHQDASCTEIQDILEAYLADELDASTQATVTRHIASCLRCQNEVRLAEAVGEALQELPRPEPSPKIFNTIEAHVRTHTSTSKQWRHQILRLFAFWDNSTVTLVRVGALTCLIGIILFGIYHYQHHTRIAQASHDLNYALSKLHYAVERTDFVIGEKLSEVQIDEASRRSFIIIEEASRRVFRQKINISSAIHRSLDNLNGFPEIINTKYDEHSHQEGGIP